MSPYLTTIAAVVLLAPHLYPRLNAREVNPTRRAYTEQRTLPTLTNAGIDPHSESQLIVAVTGPDSSVGSAAAYRLGGLAATDQSLLTLKRAVETGPEIICLYAALALTDLGKTNWASAAVRRLSSAVNGDEGVEIQIAGALAEIGNFEGWFVLERNLRAESLNIVALEILPKFAGMSRQAPGGVDLESLLEGLLPSTSGVKHEVARNTLTETKRRISVMNK